MPNRSGMRPEDAHRPSATPAPTASFTRLLDWIALRADLSDLAVRTFWVLRAHVHETDTDPLIRVTDADLGAMIGKSEKTAQRARRQLEQAGLLDLAEQTTRRVRDPHTGRWMPRTTNVYRVIEEIPAGYEGPVSVDDFNERFAVQETDEQGSLQDEEGVVYLVGVVGDRVAKIGTTINLKARLKALQASTPRPLSVLWSAPGGRGLESWLHARFAGCRRHGEWFDLGRDPVAVVESEARRYRGGAR